jgi:hypothetical protein
MRREAFVKILWGLLFVVLDIRLESIDLILPDFIGYLLIYQGLGVLAPEHGGFRRARVIAAVMFFASIPNFFEVEIEPVDPAFLQRQWISGLTGDLGALLPQEVGSARLLHTTRSRSSIDAHGTRNPQGDEDAVRGEYSDGTVVLILRYASPEEALRVLEHKEKVDYSFDAIRKRAETDASFQAEKMSGFKGLSGSDEKRTSADWGVQAADRVIQQWWNRGWSWWNPSDWGNKGGWSSSIVYVVEGYRSSAGAYRSAFEGERHDKGAVSFHPLFLFSMIAAVLTALLIWEICSGIMALSLSSDQKDLAVTASRRRALYLILTASVWIFLVTWFLAPEIVSGPFHRAIAGVIVVHALVGMIAMVLVMALMKRAADSL